MEKVRWLLTVLALVTRYVVQGEYTVRVNSDNGENTPDCLSTSSSHQACATLDYVGKMLPRYANRSVLVEIEGDRLDLNATAEFVEFSDLVLSSNSSNATIFCTWPTNTSDPGLKFVGVQGLTIRYLTIANCGSVQNGTSTNFSNSVNKTTAKIRSAVYILNSTDVELTNVTVCNSTGIGVALFDTNGTVQFSNSTFSGNEVASYASHACHSYPGGNGLYIELSACTPGVYGSCFHAHGENERSSYVFENCLFESNIATRVLCETDDEKFNNPSEEDFQGIGCGGGMALMIRGNASHNSFRLTNCVFSRNQAAWGAGLYILLIDYPQNNTIIVEDSTFEKNYCYHGAGGGGSVGYLFGTEDIVPSGNAVTFKNCDFRSNEAKRYAGGMSIYASRGLDNAALHNTIEMEDCVFAEQISRTASAVDVAPSAWKILGGGLMPIPVFTNCTFVSNKLREEHTKLGEGVSQSNGGVGTFVVSSFSVKFQGSTNFTDNNGTALYLTSGVIECVKGSQMIFNGNKGDNGGAINIIAYSVIYVQAHSRISFVNNKAKMKGGAIHVFSVDPHTLLSSRSCFIQYQTAGDRPGRNPDDVVVLFEGNSSPDGNSIFATSIYPCAFACDRKYSPFNTSLEKIFACVGTFRFNDSGRKVTTVARNYSMNSQTGPIPLKVIPGETHQMPICALDEFLKEKKVVYQAFLSGVANYSIKIDPSYTSIPDNRIRLLGTTGKGELTLEKAYSLASITLPISVIECPPGFELNSSSSNAECICADSKYSGISSCDTSTFTASISHGFWLGYCNREKEGELCTSNCPIGFCSYRNDSGTQLHHRLPTNSSELDDYMCGPTRTGTLCGECKPGYSVYYTSFKYRCGPNHDCDIGWLYYVLYELLPVTLLFMTILVFNISFTSGATTAFILFAQLLDSLALDANGIIQFPNAVSALLYIPRFFYRILNLDPFSAFEKLSFCIWEGATFFNVMLMRYVTTAYALGLVLCTVFVMNTWRCRRIFARFGSRTLKTTVIHGLSAFFILCYSQCSRVTILILNQSCLQGENLQCVRQVVFRSGELTAFGSEHLKYAIPAILVLVTFVTIPPLLLIAFPLSFNLLAWCGLSETKAVNWLSRIIPLQFLDSFQSCFRDRLRFFSGLYFFYRIFALAAYVYLNTLTEFYLVVEIQVILILALHAIAQPYKKRWHNILDSLIFTNIAIINGLTLFNYYLATEGKEDPQRIQELIAITSTCQLILLSLPMIYMATYVSVKIVKKVREWRAARRRRGSTMDDILEDSTRLPPLRDLSDVDDYDYEYKKLED